MIDEIKMFKQLGTGENYFITENGIKAFEELIDKVNSIEESVRSHFGEQFEKPKFETYYCPKCNEYVYSKNFEQEHFCIPKQPKEENQKSLLEQAREYKLNETESWHENKENCYFQEQVDKKISKYEQYAKEAEEKISDLKRLREKYFKEVGELKLQRQQFLKYTRNEIRKLKDENKQLKQNKIEIEIEAEEKIKEQNELLNGLKEACFNCKQAKLSEKLQQEINRLENVGSELSVNHFNEINKLQQEIDRIKQNKIEILKTINDLLLDEDYLNEHGKGYNQALKDILEQLTKAGLIK